MCAKLHVCLAKFMRELGMNPLDPEDRRIAVRVLWDVIRERIFPDAADRREQLAGQREVVKELLQEIFNDERNARNVKSTHPGVDQGD